jgi:hypothetical protein
MAQDLRDRLRRELACSAGTRGVIDQALFSPEKQHELFLQPAANGVDHPLLVRKLAGLELRVDQFAVRLQLKTAALRRNELQLADILLVGGQELARQTDGLRLVASSRTVFEFQLHDILLLRCEKGTGYFSPLRSLLP